MQENEALAYANMNVVDVMQRSSGRINNHMPSKASKALKRAQKSAAVPAEK